MMNPDEKRAKQLRDRLNALGAPTPKPKKKLAPLNKVAIPYETVAKITKGRDGRDGVEGVAGKDGVSPQINLQEIVKEVVDKIKKEKSLIISDLKDGQAFLFAGTKYGTHELMHGGSSSGGGGGGTPSDPDTSVQYNNGGSFGGSSTFTFDGVNQINLGAENDNGVLRGFDATTPDTNGGGLATNSGDGLGLGSGGNVSINAGVGGVNGDGGQVAIGGGSASEDVSATGNGGPVNITGGFGGAASGSGGAINLTAGSAPVLGTGGDMNLEAGDASSTGAGGVVRLFSGEGGPASGAGGDIAITAGSAQAGTDNGGSIGLTAGGTGGGAGGDINLIPSPQGVPFGDVNVNLSDMTSTGAQSNALNIVSDGALHFQSSRKILTHTGATTTYEMFSFPAGATDAAAIVEVKASACGQNGGGEGQSPAASYVRRATFAMGVNGGAYGQIGVTQNNYTEDPNNLGDITFTVPATNPSIVITQSVAQSTQWVCEIFIIISYIAAA